MKNYTYGWILEDRGYTVVSESEYTEAQIDMKDFIEAMSALIKVSHCGWSGVKYRVMKDTYEGTEEYMVLHNGESEFSGRWIPIGGNSKGCNFSVLGENLW